MKKGKEIWLGLSFLIALALLYGGMSFLKGKNIFSPYSTYYVRYQDVTGLSGSSPIYFNGVRVGIVRDIHYDLYEPYGIVVRIGINKKLAIPQGTIAHLDTELLGTVSMNLLLPAQTKDCHVPGDTLSGTIDHGTMSQLSTLMPQIVSLIPTIDSILLSVSELVSDSTIHRTLHNTETLTASANQTIAKLNGSMKEVTSLVNTYGKVGERIDTLAESLCALCDDSLISGIMANLDSTLSELKQLSATLNSTDGTAGKLITDPQLYDKLNQVCEEASSLLDDVKAHPSRYIHLFGRNKE